MRLAEIIIENVNMRLPPEIEAIANLARRAGSLDDFTKAIDTTVKGQSYRASNLADAISQRQDGGSLAGYDAQSQAEWFGAGTSYAVPVPRDGKVKLYRATPDGRAIMPGDYVTPSLRYAKLHIKSNLGAGKIATVQATLDDIFPADGPSEFWYAPAYLDQFSSVADFFEKVRAT